MIIATTPQIIPSGTAISPITIPSKTTLRLICFLVAPMLESIPYCLFFSATEILKLFLITNTLLTTIMNITIEAIPTTVRIAPLLSTP